MLLLILNVEFTVGAIAQMNASIATTYVSATGKTGITTGHVAAGWSA